MTAFSPLYVPDELAERDTGLSEAELDAALDPTTYVGSAGALVDRALARYAAEQKAGSG